MHRRRPSLRSTRGFTLLELLIATAVSAIVLLAINTTFFGALRLHNTTHENIDSDLTQQRACGHCMAQQSDASTCHCDALDAGGEEVEEHQHGRQPAAV